MRLLVVPIALATVTLVPAVAEASPYAIQLTAQDLHRLAPEDTAAPAMAAEPANTMRRVTAIRTSQRVIPQRRRFAEVLSCLA